MGFDRRRRRRSGLRHLIVEALLDRGRRLAGRGIRRLRRREARFHGCCHRGRLVARRRRRLDHQLIRHARAEVELERHQHALRDEILKLGLFNEFVGGVRERVDRVPLVGVLRADVLGGAPLRRVPVAALAQACVGDRAEQRRAGLARAHVRVLRFRGLLRRRRLGVARVDRNRAEVDAAVRRDADRLHRHALVLRGRRVLRARLANFVRVLVLQAAVLDHTSDALHPEEPRHLLDHVLHRRVDRRRQRVAAHRDHAGVVEQLAAEHLALRARVVRMKRQALVCRRALAIADGRRCYIFLSEVFVEEAGRQRGRHRSRSAAS